MKNKLDHNKFFYNDINDTIQLLMVNDSNMDMLASDFAKSFQEGYGCIQGIPQLSLLTKLWENKIEDDSLIHSHPYTVIILFSLLKLPIEQVISKSPIAMSQDYISDILYMCDIKSQKSVYDLDNFKAPSEHGVMIKGMQDMRFNGVRIFDFMQATIKELLESWLKKVETDLGSNQTLVYSQPRLIKVLYCYVHWGWALKKDNRDKLANFINNYLKDTSISDIDKENLKKIIRRIEVSTETLFNNNMQLIYLLSSQNRMSVKKGEEPIATRAVRDLVSLINL
jgi:hypothetical protein